MVKPTIWYDLTQKALDRAQGQQIWITCIMICKIKIQKKTPKPKLAINSVTARDREKPMKIRTTCIKNNHLSQKKVGVDQNG